MAGVHVRVSLLLLLALQLVCEARIVRHGTAVPAPVDRTLHIRSIPAVNGYNSQIYEVLMTPYLPKETLSGRAIAELRTSEGKVLGEVTLRESRAGLELTGMLSGLKPGQHLGLSIHDSGDCRQLGSIFRPDQPPEAPPSPEMPAGFLGSTLVSSEGRVYLSMTLGPRLSLNGHRSVLARGVALHPMPEPGHTSEGSTGPLGCGVLGRAPPSPAETAAARRRRHFQHSPIIIRH